MKKVQNCTPNISICFYVTIEERIFFPLRTVPFSLFCFPDYRFNIDSNPSAQLFDNLND